MYTCTHETEHCNILLPTSTRHPTTTQHISLAVLKTTVSPQSVTTSCKLPSQAVKARADTLQSKPCHNT